VELEYNVRQERYCSQLKMEGKNVKVMIQIQELASLPLVQQTANGVDMDHGADVLRHVGEEHELELEKSQNKKEEEEEAVWAKVKRSSSAKLHHVPNWTILWMSSLVEVRLVVVKRYKLDLLVVQE